MTKYCNHCRTKLDEITYFCPVCERDLLLRSRKYLGKLIDDDYAENEEIVRGHPIADDRSDATGKVTFGNDQNAERIYSNDGPTRDGTDSSEENKEVLCRMSNAQKHAGVIIAAAILLLISIGALLLHHPEKQDTAKDEIIAQEPINDVCNPSYASIGRDDKTGELYFNDTLVVFTKVTLDETEKKEITDSVSGSLIGALNGDSINLLQIKVDQADRSKLLGLSEKLTEDNDQVIYASYDFPVIPKAFDCETGSLTEVSANEQSIEANWWDIINTGAAWNSSVDTGNIKVGIICEGIDENNEAVRTVLPQLTALDETSSGTTGHAAAIIAAKQTPVNNQSNGISLQSIQGIVSGAQLDIKNWQEQSSDVEYQREDPDGEAKAERYFSSTQYVKMIKELIDEGAGVIDFSVMDQMTWDEVENADNKKSEQIQRLFEDNKDKIAEHRSKVLLCCMVSLLINEKDFLLVQPAGDEGKDIGKDINKHGGLETISESLFDELNEKGQLDKLGISSFDTIDRRLITVGTIGTEKSNDYYQLSERSNYGKTVKISAPGENVFTPLSASNGPSNDETCSGTAISAAMTAGCAAFLKAKYPEKKMNEIYDILVNGEKEFAREKGLTKSFREYPVLHLDQSENDRSEQ